MKFAGRFILKLADMEIFFEKPTCEGGWEINNCIYDIENLDGRLFAKYRYSYFAPHIRDLGWVDELPVDSIGGWKPSFYVMRKV